MEGWVSTGILGGHKHSDHTNSILIFNVFGSLVILARELCFLDLVKETSLCFVGEKEIFLCPSVFFQLV